MSWHQESEELRFDKLSLDSKPLLSPEDQVSFRCQDGYLATPSKAATRLSFDFSQYVDLRAASSPESTPNSYEPTFSSNAAFDPSFLVSHQASGSASNHTTTSSSSMSPPTPAVVGQVPKIQVSVADNSTWRPVHDLDSAGESRPSNESLASNEALRYALALECHRTTMEHQGLVSPVRPSRTRSLTYSGSVGSTFYDLRPPLQGAYAALAQAQTNGEVPYLDEHPYQHGHAQEQSSFQPGQGPTIQSFGITLATASDATALRGPSADRVLDALSGWMTTPLPSTTETPPVHRPMSPSSNFAPILDVGPARRRSSTISAATRAFMSPVPSHGRLATSPSTDSFRSLYVPGATPTAPSPIPQPWLDTGMATTCDALSSTLPLELPVAIIDAPPNLNRSDYSDMTDAFSISVSEKQSKTPHGAASLPALSQDGHEHANTLDVPVECSHGWPASVARPGRARPILRLSLPDDINNAVSQTFSVRSYEAVSTDSTGQDVDMNLRSPSESSSESSNLHTRSPIEPRVTSCKTEEVNFGPLLSQARRSVDWSEARVDIGAVDPLQELLPGGFSHNAYAQPESSQIEVSLKTEEPATSLANDYAQQYGGPADPQLQHVVLHRQLKHFVSTAPLALRSPTAVSGGILAPGMSLLDPLDLIAYSRSNYLTQPIEANDSRRLETVTDPDFIWHQSLQEGSDHLGEVSSILSSISIHRFMLPAYEPPAATNVEQRKHKPKVSQTPVVAFSWRGDIWITACVIIRILVFRLRVVGYDILNLNKLSEGVYSDLRTTREGQDWCQLGAGTALLRALSFVGALQSIKQQRIFKWSAFDHDRLLIAALQRDLDRTRRREQRILIASRNPASTFIPAPRLTMAQQLGVSHHRTGNAPLLLTGEYSVSKDFMDSLALGWHELYQFGRAPSDPTVSTTSSDVAVASATSNVSPLTSGSSHHSTIQTDNALWSVSAESPPNALRQHKRSRTEIHQTAPVVDVEGIGMDAVSTTKKRRYTTNSTGLNYLPQALYVQSTNEGRLRSGSMGTKRRLEQ